jgi:small GTP-binding protein
VKIIIIGDATVGKSSIMQRYVENKFTEKYNPTIAVDYANKSLVKEKLEVRLVTYTYTHNSFWDFSGHPEFSEVRNEFYRDATMLLLVYDMTSKRSFEALDMWVREASD